MSAPSSNPTLAAVAASTPPDASARGFLARLGEALDSLTTLRVVTVVGDVSVSGIDETLSVEAKDGGSVEAASTTMHMLNGHIANVFSPKFSTAGDGKLYEFHQAQVQSSIGMFTAHLAALKSLAVDLMQTRR